MKKVLCMIICVTLMALVSTTAFAADYPYHADGQVTINKRIYSSCTITIPETIDCDNGGGCNVIVENAKLIDSESIKIKVSNLNTDGAITLSHTDTDSTIDVNVRGEFSQLVTNAYPYIAQIGADKLDDNKSATVFCGFQVVNNNLDSVDVGDYSGIMQYEVSIDSMNYMYP